MLTNSKKRFFFDNQAQYLCHDLVKNVNYGKGFMHNCMCERAKNCGIACDITNHSRCATKYNRDGCC